MHRSFIVDFRVFSLLILCVLVIVFDGWFFLRSHRRISILFIVGSVCFHRCVLTLIFARLPVEFRAFYRIALSLIFTYFYASSSFIFKPLHNYSFPSFFCAFYRFGFGLSLIFLRFHIVFIVDFSTEFIAYLCIISSIWFGFSLRLRILIVELRAFLSFTFASTQDWFSHVLILDFRAFTDSFIVEFCAFSLRFPHNFRTFSYLVIFAFFFHRWFSRVLNSSSICEP